MLVSLEKAREVYKKLPTNLQYPESNPDYVVVDGQRYGNCQVLFWIVEECGEYYYYPFHLFDAREIASQYNYGGPICTSSDEKFVKSCHEGFVLWKLENSIFKETVKFTPLLDNGALYTDLTTFNRKTVTIELESDVEINFEPRARTAIRKANKNNVSILWSDEQVNIDLFVDAFIVLYYETMLVLGAEKKYYFAREYFSRLLNKCDAKIALAKYEDQFIAGALFLPSARYAEYHLSASNSVGRKLCATSAIIFAACTKFYFYGIKYLHLGGGIDADEHNPLFVFKKSFSKFTSNFYVSNIVSVEKMKEINVGYKTKLNVLLTSSGRRVSLLKSFKSAIEKLNLTGKVVVADCDDLCATRFVADVFEKVPYVKDNGYIERLLEICIIHEIGLLVPLIDHELLLIAENKWKFDKIGVTVFVSSVDTSEIFNDKKLAHLFFQNNGISYPVCLSVEEEVLLKRLPVFVKPALGSSSIGSAKISSHKHLQFALENVVGPIFQEFLEGEEYTMDVFVDNGNVLCIVPRLRIETRGGEISKGRTVRNGRLIDATRSLVEKIAGAYGVLTVQAFITRNNEIKFIEINPRCGGGLPLSIEAGADFPLWMLQTHLGIPLSKSIQDDWEDGVTMLRYDEAVFTRKSN
ncbi:MAG: ATP-grasp domain-containing protein [Bacillota bacterium]